jgi:hypothetical protein
MSAANDTTPRRVETVKCLVLNPLDVIIVELVDPTKSAEQNIAGLKKRFPEMSAVIDALRDERSLEPVPEGFVGSVRGGLIKPILVIPLGIENDVEVLAVCDGRQGTRALRQINEERAASGLPAMRLIAQVKRTTDPAQARQMKVVTHSRVPLSPVQEARLLKEMIDTNCDPLEAGKLFQLTTVQGVRDKLSVLNLAPEVLASIESGALKQTTAVALARANVPPAEQRKRVAKVVKSGAKGKVAKQIVATGKGEPETRMKSREEILHAAERLAADSPRASWLLRWVLGDLGALKKYPDLIGAAKKRAA